MKLYWKEKSKGLDLIVLDDNDDEFVVGGVRLTKRGIEAMWQKLKVTIRVEQLKGLLQLKMERVSLNNLNPGLISLELT